MPTVKVKPLALHGLKAPPAPAAAKIAIKPLVAHIAHATGAPPAAAHIALTKVLTLHLSPPGSAQQVAAQDDLASLASPDAQTLAGAAHAALVQDAGFWVNFYAMQAQTNPLPASHPWAGIIAQDLLAGI
jgi:hypothetical protein